MTPPTASFVASRVTTRSTRRERIRPRDDVLVERRHVDQRGGLADRVVLDVVGVGVDARGEVARPLPPLHLAVEGRGARMERRPDAHVLAGLLPVRRVVSMAAARVDSLHQTLCSLDSLGGTRSLAQSLRRDRHRRRPQRPRQRGLSRPRRACKTARPRAAPRARRRGRHRGDLPGLPLLGLLVRRVAAAARDHPRPRSCRSTASTSCRSTARSRRSTRARARRRAAATTCGGSTTTAGRSASCAAGRRATPRRTRNTAS